jgi:hypothetical protein
MVRKVGLEPTRLATHAPQTCLSANSSTSAVVLISSAKTILTREGHYVKVDFPLDFSPAHSATVKGSFTRFLIGSGGLEPSPELGFSVSFLRRSHAYFRRDILKLLEVFPETAGQH